MLRRLTIDHVGPTDHLEAEFGSRLNILTGDNSLGKSFLLDVVFALLIHRWPTSRTALPRVDSDGRPLISCVLNDEKSTKHYNLKFDRGLQEWSFPKIGGVEKAHPRPAVLMYASSQQWVSVAHTPKLRDDHLAEPGLFGHRFDWDISPEECFDGKRARDPDRIVCNGLITDWIAWQQSRPQTAESLRFRALESAILELSDPDDNIRIAEPRKVYLDDSRSFPTLCLKYGEVSLPHWSASIRRIASLAYLLVWSWQEYKQNCQLMGRSPTGDIVLLIDEIETHLHPTWQRRILPALLEVVKALAPEANVQLFVTTHSPLVLASLEPLFDPERDRLFHFEQTDHGVEFQTLPWANHGDSEAWLTSAVFDLPQARSVDAEAAIKSAEQFLIGDRKDRNRQTEIDRHLRALLRPDDPFWDRWVPPQPVKKPKTSRK